MKSSEPLILYQDDDLIAVDKPSGMIVYPDGKHDYPALDAFLKEKFGELFFPHRIDRETSGVLVVARTERAFENLKKQFRRREVQKTYRAFLYGALTEERGSIDRPIGSARGGLGPRSARKPYGRTRDAVTLWRRVLSSAQGAVSYAEVFPKTGRTHQIRVHFASIGHPVVCDPLYAPGRAPLLGFERLALHALSLTLKHPISGEPVRFEAPLPPDFIAAEEKMQGQSF